MKTLVKSITVYQTLDMKVFTEYEEAQKNEERILEDFNTNLNLTKYVLNGEVFWMFDVDKVLSHGKFTVIKVEEKSITVVDENNKILTSDFSNWHKQYMHQIHDHIQYCRGWKSN